MTTYPNDDAFHESLSARVATPETGGVPLTLSGLADTVPDYGDAASRLSQIAKPLRIDGSAKPAWGGPVTMAPHAGDIPSYCGEGQV